MSTVWNPRSLLGVYPESGGFTCVGTTQKGCRCRNSFISTSDLREADDILYEMEQLNIYQREFTVQVSSKLYRLAEVTLCPRWHRSRICQVPMVYSKWSRIVTNEHNDMVASTVSEGPAYPNHQLLAYPTRAPAVYSSGSSARENSRLPSNLTTNNQYGLPRLQVPRNNSRSLAVNNSLVYASSTRTARQPPRIVGESSNTAASGPSSASNTIPASHSTTASRQGSSIFDPQLRGSVPRQNYTPSTLQQWTTNRSHASLYTSSVSVHQAQTSARSQIVSQPSLSGTISSSQASLATRPDQVALSTASWQPLSPSAGSVSEIGLPSPPTSISRTPDDSRYSFSRSTSTSSSIPHLDLAQSEAVTAPPSPSESAWSLGPPSPSQSLSPTPSESRTSSSALSPNLRSVSPASTSSSNRSRSASHSSPITVSQLQQQATPPPSPPSPRRVPRRPLDNCYICLLPIRHPALAVWCRAQCGQNLHLSCFEAWAEQQLNTPSGNATGVHSITCGFCRAPWV